MNVKFKQQLQQELTNIDNAGLYKKERIIINPQGALIDSRSRGSLTFAQIII